MGNIGLPELVIIVIIALLVFGPGKLPELGKTLGKSIKEFKDAMKDDIKEEEKKKTHRKNKRT